MKLESIRNDPRRALIAMERYVNNGSPSGFTFVNTTSSYTRPRSDSTRFGLPKVRALKEVTVSDLGQIPLLAELGQELIFIHPDMIQHERLRQIAVPIEDGSTFQVEPTASARTVAVDALSGFIKLHYEGHLGRIIRRISLRHAQAATETDSILKRMVDESRVSASFAFYREPSARVLRGSGGIEWGMVWRPDRPYGRHVPKISCVIPAFALFSLDCRETGDRTLLEQLGELHARPIDFVLGELLQPLLEIYFDLLSNAGLQGECHAQNVLFGFDSNWRCVATILRDLESVDRDMPLMERAGQAVDFPSCPYKCVRDGPTYAIRHSFMFDHKLGEYLLAPIVDHASEAFGISKTLLERSVIDMVMSRLRSLPRDFFPSEFYWYKFAPQLIDQSVDERPYVKCDTPRFRARA